MNDPIRVVKVGGSLLDLPDLGLRLRRWLDRPNMLRTLLVMGGGATADVIRRLDERHHLGDERSHWLALRALTLNSHVLASLLPRSVFVLDGEGCCAAWERERTPILDPHAFMLADEGQPSSLPHRWDVTTDSVAARVAEVFAAETLVLLKSCAAPQGTAASDWAALGLVDGWFPKAAAKLKDVRWFDFPEARHESP